MDLRQAVVGSIVIWIALDSFLKLRCGFTSLILLQVDLAQLIVRIAMAGLNSYGLLRWRTAAAICCCPERSKAIS